MSYEKLEVTKGLMEVYTAMYASQEEIVGDTVEQLNEAPMTAFQAAGGQARLDQINRGRGPRQGRATAADLERKGQDILYKAGGGDAAIRQGPQRNAGRGGMQPTLTRQDIINRGTVAAAKPTKPQVSNIPPAEGTGRGGPSDIRRTSTPTASTTPARPAAPAATKTAPTAAPAGQTGDKAKDMATWAKENSKLAAASAEKARIRGTQQTDNPLMKDMRSRLPMNSPSVQSPDVAKLGKDGKGNQSLVSNPNAFKAAPPKPVATSTAPEVKATNTIAAKTTPTPVTPKAPTLGSKKPGSMVSHFDPFDVIKGHLLDEGYADTEEAALKIMANMSEEWRQSIVEGEENKEYSQKPFTGEGPKKPKGWKPTGRKLKTGQRPGYAR